MIIKIKIMLKYANPIMEKNNSINKKNSINMETLQNEAKVV